MQINKNLKVYDKIEDLIGNINNPTPIIKLSKKVNPSDKFSIYLKLERFNIFGSIKDRVALKMIQDRQPEKGQTLLEASSGNTAIALAAIANSMGIPVEIAVPKRIPKEKKELLNLLGVKELWEADDDLCPLFPNEGARGLAKSLAESPAYKGKYVYLNQYENELNVQAHYESTGPEIWNQSKGKIDVFFAGLGTGATIMGVGKYLKEQDDSIKIIGVEPLLSDHNLPGMKKISDLTEEYIPGIFDPSLLDDTIEISDEEAYKTGILMARTSGLLVGPTTGAIVKAAIKYGETNDGIGVAISPDDAYKYNSFYSKYIS